MPGIAGLLVKGAGVLAEYAQESVDRKAREVFAAALAHPAECRWMGWQVARHLLDEGGAPSTRLLTGIPHGQDHYDPDEKVVYLAEDVCYGRSVFAVAVAAHEAGHAIQDATNDPEYLANRDACKVARRADTAATIARLAGLGGPVVPVAAAVIARWAWQSRLRVEQDASDRGVALLRSHRLVAGDDEARLIAHVLKAAYATYDIR